MTMLIMQERRAKNKMKTFLLNYCKDKWIRKALQPKELAQQLGLKTSKEMFAKCVNFKWTPEEIKQIALVTNTPLEDLMAMSTMQKEREKNRMKTFLLNYCKNKWIRKALQPKELAQQLKLKTAKEMLERCVNFKWTDEEIKLIASVTGEPHATLLKISKHRGKRKVNHMRLFIKNWCNTFNMRGSDFAEQSLGLSYNGLFLKINNQRWTTTELAQLSKFTGEPFENLVKLSMNEAPVEVE